MKHLRLTHLRVIFHKSVLLPLRSDPSGPRRTRDSDEDSALNKVHGADIYLAAVQLVNMIQSLRYVLFTTCGVCKYDARSKYWHSSKAWRVADHNIGDAAATLDLPSDTGLKLVEISGEAAETVIDEEELHMGRRGEVSDGFLCNFVWHMMLIVWGVLLSSQSMVANCIENASK